MAFPTPQHIRARHPSARWAPPRQPTASVWPQCRDPTQALEQFGSRTANRHGSPHRTRSAVPTRTMKRVRNTVPLFSPAILTHSCSLPLKWTHHSTFFSLQLTPWAFPAWWASTKPSCPGWCHSAVSPATPLARRPLSPRPPAPPCCPATGNISHWTWEPQISTYVKQSHLVRWKSFFNSICLVFIG